MSCPDWHTLCDRRQAGPGEGPGWQAAMLHLDDCPSCQSEAPAADPLLLFRRLPVLEAGADQLEAMKRAVAGMRRGETIERRLPARGRQVLRAAALAVVFLGLVLLRGAQPPTPAAMPLSPVAELAPEIEWLPLVETTDPSYGSIIQLVDDDISVVVVLSPAQVANRLATRWSTPMLETLHFLPWCRRPARLTAVGCVALLGWLAAAVPAAAEGSDRARGSQQQVYVHTLKHQQAGEALALVQPLLTENGTVEVQPGDNTLVIRETQAVVARIARLLATFDHPPEELRFQIQIVRAGPKRHGISPPLPEARGADAELSEELVARLRKLLRYDDYRVLAKAGVTSREGEEVSYALGQTYNVSFRSGPVLAGRQVKLEGFRITKQAPQTSDKGRRLEPRELFHATLNLWIDQTFNLVLAHDESRQEALMVAISCRRESAGAAEKTPAAGAAKQRAGGSPPGGRPAEGGR